MRKKIVGCIGLIALVVAAPVVLVLAWPERVPLRVGMTGAEVDRALGHWKPAIAGRRLGSCRRYL